MNLVIDQGNSSVKIALFDAQNRLCHQACCREEPVAYLTDLLKTYSVHHAIYASVLPEAQSQTLLNALREILPFVLWLDQTTPLPITIGYHTPETLGRDRIAAVVGAVSERPGSPCLIIDAGTAITYDFVTAEGCFEGGNIAPGVRARFEILHQATGRLPLVTPEGETPFWGYDTETAIRSGIMNGILYEMEQYIERYRAIYPSIFVFLTGGDSKYFAAKLKNSIFADRNLVEKGLNRILNDYVSLYPQEVSLTV